jgi:hypothetical protein
MPHWKTAFLALGWALAALPALALGGQNRTDEGATMTKQFHGKRAILTRDITIEATPAAIFPLLCPVREGEWAEGWVGKAIYAESGLAETNGVYASEHGGEEDTIWFVTRRDEAKHEIEFVYFVPKMQVVRLLIRLTPAGVAKTTLSVEYIRTGISEAGNEFIDNSAAHFDTMMTEWEASMNHYMKTGTMLKESH